MDLITNSKDLLNIVLCFCALWLTIFIAWFIYYLAMTMRQVFMTVKETRRKINKIDEAIKTFKEKIEHSASYLLLVGEGIKKLVEVTKAKTKDLAEDYIEKKKTGKKK
ncbi:hypothetical protein KKC67_02955 [Patescibacteria group bacterium]|nr:hypothetical protein [Patescibacteria group bacterium]MBU0879414.1 hypothetical protein [Patescibacteria group bacterium]MBU0879930.1 hypothetical protein [Patescibacteria group bacterium]MBU0897905.1 hypothetical protein [Patescibacteria group bacterium]MBU1062755.1 hypothetical protein [Patescibacteria group bacterium]